MESTFVNLAFFFFFPPFNFDLKHHRASKILKVLCFSFNEGDYDQGATETIVCVGWLCAVFLRGRSGWEDKCSRQREKNVPTWEKLFEQFTLILVILSPICRWQWSSTACFRRKGVVVVVNPKIKTTMQNRCGENQSWS